MNFFGSTCKLDSTADRKRELKGAAKDANRQIIRDGRSIDREIRDLARAEKDLIAKIKIAHKKGQESEKRAYAKQLVQVRHTKERLETTNRQLSGIKVQNSAMASSAIAVEAMGGATAAMAAVNQAVDPTGIQKTMMAFSRQMEQVSVQDEMWGDVMEEFDGDGLGDEADQVYDQVLDELGLEVAGSMPTLERKPNAPIAADVSDAELEEFLMSMPTPAPSARYRQNAA